METYAGDPIMKAIIAKYMKLHKAQWKLICEQSKATNTTQKDMLDKRITKLAGQMNAISRTMTQEERSSMQDEVAKFHTGKPFHQPSISTVNVVQLCGETDMTIRAFPDTPEGNAKAEEIFKACMMENGDVTEADVPSYIEDGYWSIGTYQIFLVHSS